MGAREPEGGSLAGLAARGGLILGAATAVESVAQILRAFLLARILSPSEFGLMGMALIVIYLAESFTETGFYRALVQKKDRAEDYLDTVWTVGVLRGALIGALVWATAPWAGAFFATPGLTPIVRTVALVFVVQGFQNPALALIERGLAFARYAAPNLIGVTCDLVASVLLALALRSVWAMVWGFLIGRFVCTALTYAVRPYRPRPALERNKVLEFYGYGKHVFRSTVVEYVISQTDKVFVGRLLGVEPLGLFSFASRLASIPAKSLFAVVSTVTFPVFARIQDQADRVRSAFARSLGLTALLAAPIYAGLLVIAEDLVAVCLGERWLGMVGALRALCVGGPMLALYFLMGAALSGAGRPEVTARGNYVFLAALVPSIYPAILSAGILGAAWCVTLAGGIAFVYLLVAGAKAVGCGLVEAAWGAFPPVLASAAMAGVLVLWGSLMPRPASGVILAGEILVGATLYPAFLLPLDRAMSSGLLPSVRSLMKTT